MGSYKEQFRAFNDDIGFLELGTAGSYGFDLPTFEDQTRFKTLFNEVIVKCFLVLNDAHVEIGVPVGDCARYSIGVTTIKTGIARKMRGD